MAASAAISLDAPEYMCTYAQGCIVYPTHMWLYTYAPVVSLISDVASTGYIYIYLSIYLSIYLYIYTHTHTHTHLWCP